MNLCVALIALVASGFAHAAVEWDFPRLGNCHEGMAFSDGVTGVLAWGGGDTLNLTVGRADLWDHRGGYPWSDGQSYTNIVDAIRAKDEKRLNAIFEPPRVTGVPRNPYVLPLGRIVVTIPGAELKHGELDPFTGTAWIDFVLGGEIKRMNLAMAKIGGGVFAVKLPDGVDYSVEAKCAMEMPDVRKALQPVGFKDAEMHNGGFTWRLPADKSVTVRTEKYGGELFVRTWRGEETMRPDGQMPFDAVHNSAKEYWRRFWENGARVHVPDPVIQQIFDYGMYRFGAMTDPDGVPAPLQGPWIEDYKLPPWKGDYHFNINVQMCYSPAYRSGHLENLMPLFKMVLSWRDSLRENARKFVGIDDGYVLPHSVDDRGICIGGYWMGTIDHASTAWVADMMWRYVKYSGDEAFLREYAWDFMKGAMKVYRAMMEERGGRLSIPKAVSPEWGAKELDRSAGRDPSFQLAAAHRLARDCIAAARRLGEVPDETWLDVEKRLPSATAGESGFEIFEGMPLSESHHHHSHMAGFYPFDTIDLADPEMLSTVEATYRNWVGIGHGNWVGWSLPWAAVLNTHFGRPEAAVAMLRDWDAFFCDEGHGSHHQSVFKGFTNYTRGRKVMQMDAQCAAATAVMELVAHEVNGNVEFFKGCPASWKEVSFERIALSDGRRVSGRRTNGVVDIKEETR